MRNSIPSASGQQKARRKNPKIIPRKKRTFRNAAKVLPVGRLAPHAMISRFRRKPDVHICTGGVRKNCRRIPISA
jgi:hypothetical protein